MAWTDEQKIAALLRLPWTIRVERDPQAGYFVARVMEVPSAIATGETEKELEIDLWESLRASLEVYLTHGDAIPLPAIVHQLPWDARPEQRPTVVRAKAQRGSAWERVEEATASTTKGTKVPAYSPPA